LRSPSENPSKSGTARRRSKIVVLLSLDDKEFIPPTGSIVMIGQVVGKFENEEQPQPTNCTVIHIIAEVGKWTFSWIKWTTMIANRDM
jgi:hypothetical protein